MMLQRTLLSAVAALFLATGTAHALDACITAGRLKFGVAGTIIVPAIEISNLPCQANRVAH